MTTYEAIHTKVSMYHQEHLVDFYHELDEHEQQALLKQIDQLDLSSIPSMTAKGEQTNTSITALPSQSALELADQEKAQLYNRGVSLLSEGKVAVVLLAGGQGTRLGHVGPKGTVTMDDTPETSLFALQAKQIQAQQREANVQIPWYIMTSPINDKDTRTFFADNHYFGLKKEQVTFFIQDVSPAITPEGKIILADKGQIFQAPNGNGGVFTSMKKAGILKEMKANGIEWIFFNNIDNALVQVADPLFIGYADRDGADISTKSVKKVTPSEKVGVLGQRDGRPAVIEYSELTEEERHHPLLQDANIGIHLFKLDFLYRTADASLPYHLAHKKIPSIATDGTKIDPVEPNGYKLELFYFDVFPLASSMTIFQVDRENEFLPVKNKTGQDSLEEARTRFSS
ncbi:UTP--glucose-1-phosphate uridylyltransferase [Shouchella miscanthi]|uniref:UTP--glucose-1-phosphate uridylyltransferase n=1 Tax=Shouchella miscanthi TaxID=2598861 RepID=UPI0011A7BD26|nr:UDPGP type 1 family protein [Shouchella miscanthi]